MQLSTNSHTTIVYVYVKLYFDMKNRVAVYSPSTRTHLLLYASDLISSILIIHIYTMLKQRAERRAKTMLFNYRLRQQHQHQHQHCFNTELSEDSSKEM